MQRDGSRISPVFADVDYYIYPAVSGGRFSEVMAVLHEPGVLVRSLAGEKSTDEAAHRQKEGDERHENKNCTPDSLWEKC